MASIPAPVTVVIPAWGDRYVETLPRAVSSVRAQGDDISIVVVDNASEPAVPDVPGTVMVRSESRLSAGAARNLGLASVATDYVVFLDADDELIEGALDALLAGITGSEAVAVYSLSLLEAETGIRHRSPRQAVGRLVRAGRLFAALSAIWSLYPIQGNAVMRTRWVRDSGGYADSSGGEDWVLAVSQAFRGRVILDSRPGLLYHGQAGSLWRRTRGTRDLLAAAGRVRERLRHDPAIPRWVGRLSPAFAVAQTALIVLIRPLYRGLRALLRPRR
jgi:hypothetical protein